MSYHRSSTPRYNPRLRRVSGGRVKASLTTATAGAAGSPGSKKTITFRKVMDITRFLARYLSGKKNITVRPIRHPLAGFSAQRVKVSGRPFFRVNVPDWRYYDLPLPDQKRYTVYKWGLSHETGGHVRWTPREAYTHGVDKKDVLAHDVMNIIEDRRVEDLETEMFPGHLPDRLFANGYALSQRPDPKEYYDSSKKIEKVVKRVEKRLAKAKDKSRVKVNAKIIRTLAPLGLNLPSGIKAEDFIQKLKEIPENYRKAARYEMFMQRLIVGSIKNGKKVPKNEFNRVEETAKDVEKMLKKAKRLAYDSSKWDLLYRNYLAPAVDDVIKRLGLEDYNPEKPPGRDLGIGQGEGDWQNTFTVAYADKSGKDEKQIQKNVEQYLDELEKEAKKDKREDGDPPTVITKEDIEKARQGSDQTKKEFEKISGQISDEVVVPELEGWSEVSASLPPDAFKDYRFEQEMMNRLRHWRKGRKEIFDNWGSFISVPAFLQAKETPFLREIRKSVKGQKLLFIVDFSGSMYREEADYKRALISGMNVLSSIGTNIALVGFGGESWDIEGSLEENSNFFFRVKAFEEPKWTSNHAGKLAALSATYPSTPTPAVYGALANYIRKHRPAYTITITDGLPNSGAANPEEETKYQIRNLKKYTKMIAFGISPSSAQLLAQTLKEFGYNGSFAVSQVHEIPEKLVKLIAPKT